MSLRKREWEDYKEKISKKRTGKKKDEAGPSGLCGSITPGGGTPIWNGRGCSSEILNLTPKGDHLGVAQAFCDP